MSAGKVVFDGTPEQLTESMVNTLYGIDADEVMQKPVSLQPSTVDFSMQRRMVGVN
jgi:ABC-type cobalamin/Fe3+-siderophores transport system ATPase subunit